MSDRRVPETELRRAVVLEARAEHLERVVVARYPRGGTTARRNLGVARLHRKRARRIRRRYAFVALRPEPSTWGRRASAPRARRPRASRSRSSARSGDSGDSDPGRPGHLVVAAPPRALLTFACLAPAERGAETVR